jgi:hypothetical protein
VIFSAMDELEGTCESNSILFAVAGIVCCCSNYYRVMLSRFLSCNKNLLRPDVPYTEKQAAWKKGILFFMWQDNQLHASGSNSNSSNFLKFIFIFCSSARRSLDLPLPL